MQTEKKGLSALIDRCSQLEIIIIIIVFRNIFHLAFLILIFISCRSVDNHLITNDLINENLKGKVKTVELYVDSSLVEYKKFNKKGVVLEYKTWSTENKLQFYQKSFYKRGLLYKAYGYHDGKIKRISHFYYNSNGLRISEFELRAKFDTTFTKNYSYDSNDRIIKQDYKYKNDTPFSYSFEYEQNKIKEFYSRKGLITEKMITNQGRVSEIIKYDPLSKIELLYNSFGDVIRERESDNYGITDWTNSYEYDKYNNWVMKKVQLTNESLAKYVRKRKITYYE
jgi:hypothetical protein